MSGKCPKCGKNAIGTVLDGMCAWCWRDKWDAECAGLARQLAIESAERARAEGELAQEREKNDRLQGMVGTLTADKWAMSQGIQNVAQVIAHLAEAAQEEAQQGAELRGPGWTCACGWQNAGIRNQCRRCGRKRSQQEGTEACQGRQENSSSSPPASL